MDYLREKNIRQFIHKVRSWVRQGSALCFVLCRSSPAPVPSAPAFGDGAWLGCLCVPHPFLDASCGCCLTGTHMPRVAPLAACSSVQPALAQT